MTSVVCGGIQTIAGWGTLAGADRICDSISGGERCGALSDIKADNCSMPPGGGDMMVTCFNGKPFSRGGGGCGINVVVAVAAGSLDFPLDTLESFSVSELCQMRHDATDSLPVDFADIALFFLFNKLSCSASLFIALITSLFGLLLSSPWEYLYDVVGMPSNEVFGRFTIICGTL